MTDWPNPTVAQLQSDGILLVEDGNHGEYRPRPHEFVDGGTAFIRATDLVDDQVMFADAGGINEVAVARVRKGIGRPGDIIFSHKGTVGKLARVPFNAPPFVCSPQTTFWRILDESRLRRDYLYAFMRSKAFINQWWVRKGETDMADYVSLTAQRQLRIAMPPVEMQERMARPIAALDDLIDNNRRRIQVLDEMARAIYREWFVHFRFPGHKSSKMSPSGLGPMPEGWQVTLLAKVAAVNRASRVPRAGEEVIYLDISCLGDRSVDVPTAIDGGDAPGRARRVVAPGDVLWSMVRPNRRAHALLVDPRPECIGSTGLAVLSPAGVPSSFLFEAVSTRAFSDYLVSKESGAAYPAVRPADFEAAQLMVPPPELLQQFDDAVDPLHHVSWKLREQSRVLSGIRDLVLPRLVSGQVDLPALDLKPRWKATA